MRILVAEDDRDMNAILVSRLKKEHYSVDTCFREKRRWTIWPVQNMM